MRPKYTINKVEGKHLVYENRLHLAREWNKQVKALSAKLSFRGFARMMHIPASTWRREYYAGGGTKPVRDLKNPNRLHFGEYDPDLAQRVANERAAQKGPRQKLLKPVADRIAALVKGKGRHRSLYDARQTVVEEHPAWVVPGLRTLYYHVEAGHRPGQRPACHCQASLLQAHTRHTSASQGRALHQLHAPEGAWRGHGGQEGPGAARRGLICGGRPPPRQPLYAADPLSTATVACTPEKRRGRTFEPRGPAPPEGRGRGYGSGASGATPKRAGGAAGAPHSRQPGRRAAPFHGQCAGAGGKRIARTRQGAPLHMQFAGNKIPLWLFGFLH